MESTKRGDEQNGHDPEGVELVGNEAEGSGDEVEFAQEDPNDEEQQYIDMANISPELLQQLQEQARGTTQLLNNL
jgi:hypothetical protein